MISFFRHWWTNRTIRPPCSCWCPNRYVSELHDDCDDASPIEVPRKVALGCWYCPPCRWWYHWQSSDAYDVLGYRCGRYVLVWTARSLHRYYLMAPWDDTTVLLWAKRSICRRRSKLSLVVLGLVMVERNKVNVVCGVSILCGFGMFSRKDVCPRSQEHTTRKMVMSQSSLHHESTLWYSAAQKSRYTKAVIITPRVNVPATFWRSISKIMCSSWWAVGWRQQ